MMHRLIIILAAIVSVGIYAAPADAAVRHIDAACGMKRGNIVIPFKHRYHVRIGPKHVAGSYRCHGRVHRHRHKGAALIGSWLPFDLGSWSWRGVLDVGVSSVTTTAACSAFAGAMIGEIGTAGLDSPVTWITGAACLAGGKRLQDQIRTHISPRG
jgi:hypothetical protein